MFSEKLILWIITAVISPEQPNEASGQAGHAFATTRWSVVARAADSQSPEGAAALERLCHTYWYPLYAFVRHKGYQHEDACDLTQAFFAKLLEKGYLKSADSNLGRFRTFLLTSMSHFLANEWDKARTQKRGGAKHVFSLDEAAANERYDFEPIDQTTPETLFERHWAEAFLGVVLDRLAAETDETRFAVLKDFLVGDESAVSYERAAGRLGMTVPAVTSAIHRMRARFGAVLVDEIANTVSAPEDVEPEVRYLLRVLTN